MLISFVNFESCAELLLSLLLTDIFFFCNFIPKLKCCRVSFKSQKCASLSCAQWDIWLTFKYLFAPLDANSKKSYISSNIFTNITL